MGTGDEGHTVQERSDKGLQRQSGRSGRVGLGGERGGVVGERVDARWAEGEEERRGKRSATKGQERPSQPSTVRTWVRVSISKVVL